MDRFLHELEAALSKMTDDDRREVVETLRAFIHHAPGLRFLRAVSKLALVKLLGSITIALSSDRTPEEWLAKVEARAKEIAPHVVPLFHAV